MLRPERSAHGIQRLLTVAFHRRNRYSAHFANDKEPDDFETNAIQGRFTAMRALNRPVLIYQYKPASRLKGVLHYNHSIEACGRFLNSLQDGENITLFFPLNSSIV